MTAGAPGLHVARDSHVLHLTLDRADKANALDAALVEALLAQLGEAATDGTRLVVVRANGKHFCAGFDFTGFEEQSEGDLLLRFVRIEQLLQAIYAAPFATLALAHGRVLGAGADLLAACSRRIAAPETSFAFPGARFGLVLGTRRLAQRIGNDAARRIVALGQTVAAEQACELGLVDEIVATGDWTDRIAIEANSATLLEVRTAATLLRLTRADSGDADMAELVASAARPGLKRRIRAYREQAQASR